MMSQPDGERIAVLETQLNSVLAHQAAMQKDISEMKEILQQAKGARFLIVVGAGLAGFLITYLPWFAQHLGLVKNG